MTHPHIDKAGRNYCHHLQFARLSTYLLVSLTYALLPRQITQSCLQGVTEIKATLSIRSQP